jgi:DNA-binding transcriptional MerR regulator
MFRIGEFARFTKVSVKMLRHYDEIGLLPPARVDAATGYRYYRAAQLPRLNRILLLRELGFGLDDIGRLVEADDGVLDTAYDERETELRDLLDRTGAQLRALRARRQMLAAAGADGLTDVVIRPVAAAWVATLPATDDVAAAFYRVETHVRRRGARAARPPCMLVPPDGEALVAVPLTRRILAADGVAVSQLPAVDSMACSVHRGRYSALAGHLQRMLVWLEDTGRRPEGTIREVYLRFDAEPELSLPPAYLTSDADELVTELQVPVSLSNPSGPAQ